MARIEKYDHLGRFAVAYEGRATTLTDGTVRVDAFWERDDRDLGYVVFAHGDHFTEYFFGDQWFNIMRVGQADDDVLKGWYCNISHPARVSPEIVSYVDLALDLWVRPDGTWLVLDEDEFAAITISETDRAGALAGLALLTHWVSKRMFPFSELARGIE